MKILVDELPKSASECPFAKSENTVRAYSCTLKCNESNWDISCEVRYNNECPFLKEVK